MDVYVHIAQDIMIYRNGYECKVIPIMYNMSPAKVFIADGIDWCSDLANFDSGRLQLSADIEDVKINL